MKRFFTAGKLPACDIPKKLQPVATIVATGCCSPQNSFKIIGGFPYDKTFFQHVTIFFPTRNARGHLPRRAEALSFKTAWGERKENNSS
jgi:hypothetical protein